MDLVLDGSVEARADAVGFGLGMIHLLDGRREPAGVGLELAILVRSAVGRDVWAGRFRARRGTGLTRSFSSSAARERRLFGVEPGNRHAGMGSNDSLLVNRDYSELSSLGWGVARRGGACMEH